MADRVPISKKLVLINSTSSVVAHVLNVTVLLWAIQYLLRRVPPAEYQLLPIVMGVMMLLPLLTSVLTFGLARFITEAYAKSDDERIRVITSTMFPILLGTSLLVLALGGLCVVYVDRLLVIPPEYVGTARWMFGVLFTSAAIRLPFAPFGVGLFVRQQFVLENLIHVGGTLLRVLLLVVLLLGVSPSVLWVVVSQVVANLTALFVQTAFSCRLVPQLRFHPGKIDLSIAAELVTFGIWVTIGNLAGVLRQAVPPILLNYWATPVDVNVFHIGSTVDSQLKNLAGKALAPILPALTAMHADDQRRRIGMSYMRGGRIMIWLLLGLATPLVIFREEILHLFLRETYPTYAASSTVLVLLLMALIVSAPRMLLLKSATAIGDLRPLTTRTMVIQVLAMLLAAIFVYAFGWGAVGCAAAILIVMLIAQPLWMWSLGVRMLDISWREFFNHTLYPGATPAIVAVVAGALLRRVVAPESLPALAASIAAMLAVYALVCLGCLTPADRRDVQRLRSRWSARRSHSDAS